MKNDLDPQEAPINAGEAGSADQLASEAIRRRTFAIISHPDAGKTTLTEKFLLYAGCIDVAGTVRGRKTRKTVTSDFMELEQQRGISVSSTALSFAYKGYIINLLDTPGHQDFSEDTYRTLAAADSAVMVIDAAKGIETQTRKLFKVCAVREIPILTFINKMDRPSLNPLSLLSEIEEVLGIVAVPVNWPIGNGPEFCGVYDRLQKEVLLFEPTDSGSLQVPIRRVKLEDLEHHIDPALAHRCQEDLELLDGAAAAFEQDAFLSGKMTPVFFGSAMNNFGMEAFLEAFLKLAPAPGARRSDSGMIPPDRPDFAGIVFKIQANMDPMHRDKVAFVRVCSGIFTKDTRPKNARTGERVRIKGSHRVFAREREEVGAAYPGDIVGLAISGGLRLGDTVHEGKVLNYEGLPQFSPECFAVIRCLDTSRRKQMSDGLEQLADEGAIQVFEDSTNIREPILAAVGVLQFDVVRSRLDVEYGVKVEIESLKFKAAAWIKGERANLEKLSMTYSSRLVEDHRRRLVVLAEDSWNITYMAKLNPGLTFRQFSEELFVPEK
ncbi:MAG: peptide chain release factor 3 [Planctomycetota bacterium]